MNASFEDMLIVLLVGYAAGTTLVVLASRGRSRETVVVVPDPQTTERSSIGCIFVAILAIATCVFLLATFSHLK